MRIFLSIFATAATTLALAAPANAQKCDYRFSGSIAVQHNGVIEPLKMAQVRVKRRGGTGAGRATVRSNGNGEYDGSWTFDRDGNGLAPGRPDIQFDVQVRLLQPGMLAINAPRATQPEWQTIASHSGKDCQRFLLTRPTVLDTDRAGDPNRDFNRRAFIWTAYRRLQERLGRLELRPDKQMNFVYPDRTVGMGGNDNGSYYVLRGHIDDNDWNNIGVLIHEYMHGWHMAFMRGEISKDCIWASHHKAARDKRATRCSGFMEGFAEATGQQLTKELFDGQPYYRRTADQRLRFYGPLSSSELRSGARSGNVGPITNRDEAERTDVGWTNFLLHHLWPNIWMPAVRSNEPGVDNLGQCQPMTPTIWQLLKAVKNERPSYAGGQATFNWFAQILRGQVDGYTAKDATTYQTLGDPSESEAALQQRLCPRGKV
ncbi:hypothetical protein WJS89_06255 [Sphingomicrobium sp. XHP0235]|uniref:hypothetical protein n=1 Tax=Sphingomicrobium aquimarinum TaxID=3133971 RepID=UPI0031FEEF4A